MIFLWPQMLVLLLALPVLILLYILAQRRRRKNAVRYGSLSFVKDAIGNTPRIRRHIPPLLLLLAIAILLTALARPVAVIPIPTPESTVILAFDVSGSMLADDLAPNRLDAAKSAARSFVEHQNAIVRIGIVSFSDNAFIVQTPTNDRDAVLAAIDRLSPQRGTAIGLGIRTSMDAINAQALAEDALLLGPTPTLRPGTTPIPTATPMPLPPGIYAPAIIILLSDGESNLGPNPLEVLEAPKNEGVRIYTVGLGKPEGVIVHLQGRAIKVRLDEAVMKSIAAKTGGDYSRASNETDLRTIYEKLATHVIVRSEKTEITALFTALGAAVALLAGILSLLWFNRIT